MDRAPDTIKFESYSFEDWKNGTLPFKRWIGPQPCELFNENGISIKKFHRYMSEKDYDMICVVQEELYHKLVRKETKWMKNRFLNEYENSGDKQELLRSEIFIIDELLKNTSKEPLPITRNDYVAIGDKESSKRDFLVVHVRNYRACYHNQVVKSRRDYSLVNYEEVHDYPKPEAYFPGNNNHLHFQIMADAYANYLNWLTEGILKNKPVEDKPIKVKPSLKEIAWLYIFEGKTITRENGDEIAKEYGHNSGEKLYQYFSKYRLKSDRTADDGKTINKSKLKLYEKVIKMLPEDKKSQAISEMNLFKKDYDKYQ